MKSALEKLGDEKISLGQFFTPKTVIEMTLAMVSEVSAGGKSPRIADPACGHGEFLSFAVQAGYTTPTNVYGTDVSKDLRAGWRRNPMLKSADLRLRDGLLVEEHEQGAFDWVVGNPPFGSGQVMRAADFTPEAPVILHIRNYYHSWAYDSGGGSGKKKSGPEKTEQIFQVSPGELRKIKRLPDEVLFLEKFMLMAKPRGVVGIILPAGIFSNTRFRGFRNWLSSRATIEAVVSLPRNTFKDVKTLAKTCLLVLSKKTPVPEHKPFLSVIKRQGNVAEEIGRILDNFRNHRKDNSESLIPSQHSQEFINRMEPEYWINKPDRPENGIEWRPLAEFLDMKEIGQGPKGRSVYVDPSEGIQYIRIDNIVETGIDPTIKPVYVEKGGPMTAPDAFPKKNYVLLVRTGATIGKVAYIDETPDYFVSSVVYKLRFKNIHPAYVVACLKSNFGQDALRRFKNGVGVENLNLVSEVPAIEIPILDEALQKAIVRDMTRASEFHRRAIELKQAIIATGVPEAEAQFYLEVTESFSGAEMRIGEALAKLERAVMRGVPALAGKGR